MATCQVCQGVGKLISPDKLIVLIVCGPCHGRGDDGIPSEDKTDGPGDCQVSCAECEGSDICPHSTA